MSGAMNFSVSFVEDFLKAIILKDPGNRRGKTSGFHWLSKE